MQKLLTIALDILHQWAVDYLATKQRSKPKLAKVLQYERIKK